MHKQPKQTLVSKFEVLFFFFDTVSRDTFDDKLQQRFVKKKLF